MQRDKPDAWSPEGAPPSENNGYQADIVRRRRAAPRFPLPVRACVSIPGMADRDYGVCEISLGGMFLAFLDVAQARPEYEQSGAGPGSELKIAFEVTLPASSYRCEIPARIVRATSSGIGVEIAEADRPKLGELIARLPGVRQHGGSVSA